jgi:hypothetical protein
MAGYSGKPLLQKLGIKHGDRVLLRNAPRLLPRELTEYSGARTKKNLNVVVLFATSAAAFIAEFTSLTNAIEANGMIWVAWPKKASGMETDLTEDVIRNQALKTRFVDVKVCAIDETWSGLKLVIRKEYRASLAARPGRNAAAGLRTQET